MAEKPRKERASRKQVTPIPRRLRAVREGLGLSQPRLGKLVGLDSSVAAIRVNQYEKGVHVPGYPLLARLAVKAGVPDAYFYASNDEIAWLLRAYTALDAAGQNALMARARALLKKRGIKLEDR